MHLTSTRLLVSLFCLMLIKFLTGCVTYEKCVTKFGTGQDSVKVKAIVPVVVPADSMQVVFSHELLQIMPIDGTLTTTSKNGLTTTLRKKSDKHFECEAKTTERIIRDTVEVACPQVQNFNPKPIVITKTPFWNWLIIGILSFVIAYVMVQSFTKAPNYITFQGHSNPPQPPARNAQF